MTRFVILDRDGVLNVDRPDSLTCLEDLEMVPGAARAVGILCRKGYRILVATNQACVGRGLLDLPGLEAIHRAIDAAIEAGGGRIDGWFVCTHRAEDGCDCRKPLPGLLYQAQRAFGLELDATDFIGDAGRDIEAANAAGCRPVLVGTGKGREARELWPDVCFHADLLAYSQTVNHIA